MAVFSWGFCFYGHGVYLAELQRLHGWPSGVIAGASTAFYLCSALLVAFVSDAIARLGPRRVVLVGVACLAVSTLSLPLVDAPWQLYLAYLPMTVGWASLSLGAITNLLGLWFRKKRGLAISLALNGASCGGIVIVPLLVWLVERHGFANAMAIASAAMLAVLVPLALAWAAPPPAATAAADARQDAAEIATGGARQWSRPAALRSLHFWTVAGPFALGLASQVGFLVHQIAFLSPVIGRAGAGTAVAITTFMAVIGRVGLGFVIDRLNQRAVSAASFSSQAAALFTMTQTTDPAVLLGACALYGFSVGNLITFPALIIQREFPAAAFGMLIALTTSATQLTYAFGPTLLGLLRDATGNYSAALLSCVALNAAATVIILLRPKSV
jgi:MFS family permease